MTKDEKKIPIAAEQEEVLSVDNIPVFDPGDSDDSDEFENFSE